MAYRVNEVNVLINSDGDQLVLDNGHQRAVLEKSGCGLPQIEYFTDQSQFYDGNQVYNFRYNAREIDLALTDLAQSRSEYHDLYHRIIQFINAEKGALTLRHIRKGATRDLTVRLRGGLDQLFSRGSRGFLDKVQLIAHNPFFFNPTQVSTAIDDTNTEGLGFPWGFPEGFSATGFLGKTLTYNGDVPAFPQIIITGPFTTLVLTHVTRAVSIYINSALPAGRTLTIDLDPRAISMIDDTGVDYLGASGDSDLINWYLQSGTNEISVAGTGHSVPTTSVTVTYYERYLTL